MNNIQKIINENQEEIIDIINNFVNKKMEDKPSRAPKTICYFNALGKRYDSMIFTENYTQFLKDVSTNVRDYDIFKKICKGYLKKNLYEFTSNTLKKSSVVKLNNGGYVSCYSSTEIKKEHIRKLGDELNIPVNFI